MSFLIHLRLRSTKFDEVLLESGQPTDEGSKLVSMEESLKLLHDQKLRIQVRFSSVASNEPLIIIIVIHVSVYSKTK